MLPNQVYYYEVGKGTWGGSFGFRITDRETYRKARVGFVNRCLILAMRMVVDTLGPASISSTITVDQTSGTGWNTYALSKWGVTLCVFKDVYQLDARGELVKVITNLRFGPIPGILTGHVEYSARITEGGFRSRYEGLRMLGAEWVAGYEVAPDKAHVKGVLTCPWGEATEDMFRRT